MRTLPLFMRSVAHATLLDLSESFRRSSMYEAARTITDLLDAFSASESTDLHAFTQTWLAQREHSTDGDL